MNKKDYGFYKDIEIRFYDCDNTHRARISTIMKYVADIAGIDYTQKGYSHQWLWERGFVFLLSRVSIHINRMPIADERLVVETWEREIKGPLFYRDYNIYSQDGEKLVEASTAWVLANPETRQILRPSEFTGQTDSHPSDAANVLELGRFKPKSQLEAAGDRKIVYSDIDGNNHVYNAVYGDIASDCLPSDIISGELSDFRINYKHEALLGDIVDLHTAAEQNTAYVCGLVEGKTSFECEFVFR